MSGFLLIGVLSLVGFSTSWVEPQADNKPPPSKQSLLAPAYSCSGVVDGKPYALALVLEPFEEGYRLTWTDGPNTFKGFGLRHGDAMAVFGQDPKGNVFLSNYRIEPGTLDGRWMVGDGVVHPELCLVGKPA